MQFYNRQFKSVQILFLLAVLLASLSLGTASPSALSALISSTSNIFAKPRSINGSHESKTAAVEKRQMSAGSSCDGSEGQWNCLTNQWQRCAAGQWSVVVDCAEGTICSPSGLTYDFAVQFANGAAGGPGPSTSDGVPRLVVDWMAPKALIILSVAVSFVAK
ncbi:hypothetical protein GGR53DRAFT_29015 [Hypoxylon sp. FL1150]|nr:hypothetical protein GGR53DRAFT_29015 [Hypoxylon sp. FL1150]